MSAHPSDGELKAFLAGGSARDSRCDGRVVRHLLGRCPACRARLAALDPAGYWGRGGRPSSRRPVDYDEVLARAEQTFSLFFTAGRPIAEPPGSLLAELAPAEVLRDRSSGSADRRRAIPALTRWLVARSHTARYDDPQEMLHWGLLAHLAAGSCSAEAVGDRRRLADLRARAWGQFGNALRVCGRFREAAEILAAAQEFLRAGTGDPALRARFCEHMSSLRINQKDLESATSQIAEAEEIYETLEDRQGLASTQVQRAVVFQYRGQPEAVLPLLDRAIALLLRAEDPDLLLSARLNRALAQMKIEPSARVLASFRATLRADRVSARPALMLRACWQEGQLLAAVGHVEEAETKLRAARRGFLARNLAPEVVAATRDLAGLYRQVGRRRELEETLLDTQALFAGVPVEPEVRRSLEELERMAA